MFEEVVKACKDIYYNEPIAKEARKYLTNRISLNSIDDYDFGYFPPDEHLGLLFNYIDKKELKKLFLVKDNLVNYAAKSRGHFSNHNLIFPFRDSYGNIVSLAGRTLLTEDARKELKIQKYNYTFGTRKNLYVYGLDVAKKYILEKDFVILVEGQFDKIKLQEHNIMNVVALGWADLSLLQLAQVARYTKNIIVLFDNDEAPPGEKGAGQKGVEKINAKYGGSFNLKTLTVPSGKDIDEFLKKGGDSEFLKKLMVFE